MMELPRRYATPPGRGAGSHPGYSGVPKRTLGYSTGTQGCPSVLSGAQAYSGVRYGYSRVPKRTPGCSRVLRGALGYSTVPKRTQACATVQGGTRAAWARGRQGRGRRPPTAPPTSAGPSPGNGMASQTCPGVLLGVLKGGKLRRVLTVLPNTRPRVAAVCTSAPGPADCTGLTPD